MLSKKEMEQCALDAARKAGAPIPTGELEGEEPDFRFQTPPLGIDVSELVRPACTNYGILPFGAGTVSSKDFGQRAAGMREAGRLFDIGPRLLH